MSCDSGGKDYRFVRNNLHLHNYIAHTWMFALVFETSVWCFRLLHSLSEKTSFNIEIDIRPYIKAHLNVFQLCNHFGRHFGSNIIAAFYSKFAPSHRYHTNISVQLILITIHIRYSRKQAFGAMFIRFSINSNIVDNE